MSAAKKAVPSLADLSSKKKDDEEVTQEIPDINEDSNTDKATDSSEDVSEDIQDETSKNDKDENFLSPHVVATVPNKTPAELAAESPDETATRYNINTDISKEDARNPRVQAYDSDVVRQVPSGTHLHPDVAKDMRNRGISDNTTDSAQVKRTVTETYDFAPDAEYNDKF